MRRPCLTGGVCGVRFGCTLDNIMQKGEGYEFEKERPLEEKLENLETQGSAR